ncbi:hypothetical protein [Clostridium sp.]|uniref:hypothetical protein n=1 Tax=Clostridium sp. TaxID=1506 RepID=UPI0032167CAD
MISNEIKSRVAQNCSFYNERSYYQDKLLMQLEQSCNNCENFVRGKCIKNVFYDIVDNIRVD